MPDTIASMCGRYVSPDEAAMERAWHVGRCNSNPFTRNFNVALSTQVPLLRRDAESGEQELTAARWGLIPVWWKEAKSPMHTINARSEEAATKAMWRHPLRSARCLMPAEGWYEWQKIERVDLDTGEVKEVKQPHFIYRKGKQPFCFAALMSMWTSPGATDPLLSCSILTRAASPAVSAVHDRMPVVLPDDVREAWLDPALTDAAKVTAIMRGRRLRPSRGQHTGQQPEKRRRVIDPRIGMSITVYGWRIKDKRTGRWRKLRWNMTEQDAAEWAAQEGVAIERIEGSAEVRHPILDGWGGSVPAVAGKR